MSGNICIGTMLSALISCSSVISLSVGESGYSKDNSTLTIVPREAWHARAPKDKTPLVTPVPYVVIHHSYSPAACQDLQTCSRAMRSMQDYHMDDRGWWDIGYNFAVGSDGRGYEGRGWHRVGAHAPRANNVSIGICLIGDWTSSLPPDRQLKSTKMLIGLGVQLGYVHANYTLLGHRQVRETECPGQKLYDEITTWEHYRDIIMTGKNSFDYSPLQDNIIK